jgi:tetratricopeptide (TPR) repeat protein
MEVLILLGVVFLYYWHVISRDNRKAEEERTKKEVLKPYNSLVIKAEVLFNKKSYEEALNVFEEANMKKPDYYSDANLILKIALCKFYLKDYNAVIVNLNKIDNDTAYICRAISFYKLGDYSQSKHVFKEGIQKKYPQVIQSYDNYFNPLKNKLPYWNSLEENAKILLAKNAKIDYNYSTKILSEDDIELIMNCQELDLSCRKETWQWESLEGWVIFSTNNKHIITNLEFCKYIPNIQKLNICGQQITSFEGIENHRNLIEIDASYTLITNLEALRTCINLQNLNLHCANFPKGVPDIDLEPIANLPIVKLDLTCCHIINIGILNNVKTLKELSLFRTKIVNLSQIKDLNRLEVLNVAGSEDFKLSTDCNLSNLKFLKLNCKPTEAELNSFKAKFPNCKIENNFLNSIEIFNKRPNYDPDQQDLLFAIYGL